MNLCLLSPSISHCCIQQFPLTLDSLPVLAAEKNPHSMMFPPPCFTVGKGMVWARWCVVPGFLQTWCLTSGQRVQSSIKFHQTREFCFSWSAVSSFEKLQQGCHVPFIEEWRLSSHSTIKAWMADCCRDPSGWFSALRVTIRSLVTSLTKALLPQSHRISQSTSSRKSSGGNKPSI